MNTFFRTILFLVFFIIFCSTAYSQSKDNFVRDTVLSKKLQKYLIEHIDVYTIDSTGKKMPLDAKFIQEEYGQTYIVATNLKTDSIIDDKTVIGIYKFRFACYNGCRPHLYIQHLDRIEFIDLGAKDFSLENLIQKIMKLFNKYPNQFTLQEKVKTIQGVMETVYNSKFEKYSW